MCNNRETSELDKVNYFMNNLHNLYNLTVAHRKNKILQLFYTKYEQINVLYGFSSTFRNHAFPSKY